jgi:UPF0755 protein
MKRTILLKTISIIIALIIVALITGILLLQARFNDASLNSDAKLIYFAKGTSVSSIAHELKQQNIIRNVAIFKLYVKLHKVSLQAGQYEFLPRMKMRQVVKILQLGKVKTYKITIPEGLSNYQIYQLLRKEANLTGKIAEQEFMEGVLFPATYQFYYKQQRMELLKTMNQQFERVIDDIWQNAPAASKRLFNNKYESVILASIIEKETAIAEERPKVASVFINRLEKKMRLQTDPSVIYAVTKGKYDLQRPLSRKDLKANLPHNTYVIKHLPPTAIANAGEASMRAVFTPADTDYLYFVASKDGGHKFARTLKEHNNNVKQWRKWLKSQKQ